MRRTRSTPAFALAAFSLLSCGTRRMMEDWHAPDAVQDGFTNIPWDAALHRDAPRPVPAPTVQRFTCADCGPARFPEPGATPCDPSTTAPPGVYYPSNGVLLPPNLNVLEVQFTPGTGNTLWEVDFSNAVTDVRVVTRCSQILSVRGRATGVCAFSLSQEVWDAVVANNRGGGPVLVSVRGTNDALSCSSVGPYAVELSFGEEDMAGGIYYWQSAVFGGAAGRTGGIYLHDFGTRETAPTPFLESGSSGRCVGCHNLSRDGESIAYGRDDPDADDEFYDVSTALDRVRDHRALLPAAMRGPAAGFQTFNHDHSVMLSSTWQGSSGGNRSFDLWDGATGTLRGHVQLPGLGTQPDWSADDLHVVYVQPTNIVNSVGDHHFFGGDLYTMDVAPDGTFGAARLLLSHNLSGPELPSMDANYYPSYSPDGLFLLFNHATAGDIFYNRTAQVYLATADGMNVYPLNNLNAGMNLTNSWPRWSPFVQHYQTTRILWVTFSSNRNYGVRVENDNLPNCYPPGSPASEQPQTTAWQRCAQPQLWMAAVRVDSGEFGSGRDTSWPAFWLPFQNVASHNHSAQWVSRVVNNACVSLGGTCPGANGEACCAGTQCDDTAGRCVPVCLPENTACPGIHGESCCGTLPCDPVSHTCGVASG